MRETGNPVLIVEDDPDVALELRDLLRRSKFAVVGPASSVSDALHAIAAHELSAALVDMRLGNDTADPVLDALARKGVPAVIVTGHADQVPARFGITTILHKPFSPALLIHALRQNIANVTGHGSRQATPAVSNFP
jgi:DNA-binding NtrC family response regulator